MPDSPPLDPAAAGRPANRLLQALTPIAAARARHLRLTGSRCTHHYDPESSLWPCDAARLLDALETLVEAGERLRWAEDVP